MLSRRQHFWLGFSVPFVVSGCFIGIVFILAPSSSAAKEIILNNPAITIFDVGFIPLITALLVADFPRHKWRELIISDGSKRWLAFLLLAFVLVAPFWLVWKDSRRSIEARMITPIEFGSRGERQKFDSLSVALRAAVASEAEVVCPSNPANTSAAECYKSAVIAHFGDRSPTLFGDLSIASWWQRLLTLQGTVLAGLVVFLIVAGAFTHTTEADGKSVPYLDQATLDRLLQIIGLFLAWFPFRLYSNWYDNYFSMERLPAYISYWLALVLAGVAFLVTYFKRIEKKPPQVFTLSVLATIFGVVATAYPPLLFQIRQFLGWMDVGEFLVFELVVVLLIAALLAPEGDRRPLPASAPATTAPEPSAAPTQARDDG